MLAISRKDSKKRGQVQEWNWKRDMFGVSEVEAEVWDWETEPENSVSLRGMPGVTTSKQDSKRGRGGMVAPLPLR